VSTACEVDRLAAGGASRRKLCRAPFYIDFSRFEARPLDAAALRRRLLGTTYKNIVLYVGRFARQKDVPTLIRAIPAVLHRHPRTLFVLAGDGPERAVIEKMIGSLNLAGNVLLPGGISYDEIASYFAASDIFCITSLYEGTCMVLHEAAICRLPVVATRFAGARDFIRNGTNGFTTEIGDHAEIGRKLCLLLGSAAVRREMGENNHAVVTEHFTPRQALDAYKNMFLLARSMLHRGRSTGARKP